MVGYIRRKRVMGQDSDYLVELGLNKQDSSEHETTLNTDITARNAEG